jgi:hypothetical protein
MSWDTRWDTISELITRIGVDGLEVLLTIVETLRVLVLDTLITLLLK